jgi:hypothetical protein
MNETAGDGEVPSLAVIYRHPWILLSVLEQLYNSHYNTRYNHSDIYARSFRVCSIRTISDSVVLKMNVEYQVNPWAFYTDLLHILGLLISILCIDESIYIFYHAPSGFDSVVSKYYAKTAR